MILYKEQTYNFRTNTYVCQNEDETLAPKNESLLTNTVV